MWFYITKLLKWVPIYINLKNNNNNKKLGGPLPPRPSLPDMVHNISLLFVVFLWWIVFEGTTDRDVVWVYLMTQVEISEMCVPIMEFCSSLSVHRSSPLFFFSNKCIIYSHYFHNMASYYWLLLLEQKSNLSVMFKFEPTITNHLWFVVKIL